MNETSPCYTVFDLHIRSDFPLADLPGTRNGNPDWAVEFLHKPSASEQWEWIHDWRDPRGGLQLSCARKGADYRLHFPGLADFHIDFDRARITATAAPSATEPALGQVFLDQVLPRVLFHSGRLVVHASAVTMPDGRSMAFTGPSGRGKSTLAAAYMAAGAAVITDDCLLLEPGDRGFTAIPAYPALRLWPDSLEALEAGGSNWPQTQLETGKARLALDKTAGGTSAKPLSALFLLGDPTAAPERDVSVEPLTGSRALISLIESAFVLDLASKQAIRDNFSLVSTLARSSLPMFYLNYPRRYDIFAEVQRAVSDVTGKTA